MLSLWSEVSDKVMHENALEAALRRQDVQPKEYFQFVRVRSVKMVTCLTLLQIGYSTFLWASDQTNWGSHFLPYFLLKAAVILTAKLKIFPNSGPVIRSFSQLATYHVLGVECPHSSRWKEEAAYWLHQNFIIKWCGFGFPETALRGIFNTPSFASGALFSRLLELRMKKMPSSRGK